MAAGLDDAEYEKKMSRSARSVEECELVGRPAAHLQCSRGLGLQEEEEQDSPSRSVHWTHASLKLQLFTITSPCSHEYKQHG